ncbi:MAG: Periplasmic beta-glucosidase precursor [Chloroflexi bacterium ADurb.Bin222]|nr:MAG: Periplasmic beta-glucosidase precursor [Chloroflexi bacterium ADurb.Bin222]
MDFTSFDFNTPSPEIEAKVAALLAQMTLEEKVGQLVQANLHWRDDLEDLIRQGQVGSLLSLHGAEQINHFQRLAVEESRLGIPLIVGFDVIHGLRTVFPIPLAEACTWDPDLVGQAARVAAVEASAVGIDWIFAPMVDIARDPRWGRIAEGAGEDVFLGSAMAQARVRGFQAADLPGGRRIAACPKHYAAYGAAEAGKDYNTVDVSERTLRDVYLPPFKAAFDAGAATVMSAFNEIGGVPASANAFLLKTILRETWGWEGVVLSDYDALGELLHHGFAADSREATLRAFLAGTDMDMMGNAYPYHLADLVREGLIDVALIDAAVRRVLRLKFALGLFEHPYTDPGLAAQVTLTEEHRALALEVAQKSMVLLKNEGELLPLGPAIKTIALLGPLADDRSNLLGCWGGAGRETDVESVLEGLCAVLPEDVTLLHTPGCPIEGEAGADFDAAVSAALAADVAILVLGESGAHSGEAHSRAHLGLPGRQQELLEAVVATGKPVVVVLMAGRPLVIPWMAAHVPAILMAWHGGIRAGRAIADLLVGAATPSGRLVVSFPRSEGQIPIYYAHKNTGRPAEGEGVFQFDRRHRSVYLDESYLPQFPFGYGLSYTTFAYSDLRVETPEAPLDGVVVVTAEIANTGARAGEETVQCYVRDLVGNVTRPVKELKGFQRIALQPGERRRVRFEIPVQSLGFHDLELRYVVEPGDFHVWIGPNAAEGLQGKFTVTHQPL